MNSECLEIQRRNITCMESELLISKACDSECTPEELAVLREHLRDCCVCRASMLEYQEISSMMTARLVTLSCPPPPVAQQTKTLGLIVLSPRVRRYVAAVAACFLFYMVEHHTGQGYANRQMTVTPVSVSTPSMWAASRGASSLSLANVESEQPFTDSIGRYRAAVGVELRKESVDWMKVRELVEAMGELRTDLELLTIHMAYLDIRTGSSPYEVAEHWENLGNYAGKAVYKP